MEALLDPLADGGSVPVGLPADARVASFTLRATAWFLDRLLILALTALCFGVAARSGAGLIPSILYALLYYPVASLGYVTLGVGGCGQTPGRMAVGIRVVDASTGGPVGYGTALLRGIVAGVSAGALFLGYLAAFVDPDRRTLHDRWAGTEVVAVRPGH